MVAFYIFGIVELQDMYPLIMEAKKNNECWICYFDCFPTKRQFYYYTDEELLSLFEGVNCNIYRSKDKEKYNRDYSKNNPDHIFIKTINPKTYNWFPTTKNSKVIYLNYMLESHHLQNSLTHVDTTLIHDKKWLPLYKNYPNPKYYGDYRMDNLKYISKEKYNKRCFIIESWIRGKHVKSKLMSPEAEFYDELLKFLHSRGYEIIWKKREKGYPKENKWASPLDFCNEKPDKIIEKDLMLPSSLFYYSFNSDMCLFINDCFAFFDSIKINKNSYMIKSPLFNERKYKFDEGWFDEYKDSLISFDEFKKRLDFNNKNVVTYDYVSNQILKSLNKEIGEV
tara:strand:- start:98 stop:1111 length:1014 start_codon:yes stop_codon:yes gene_type:complete